MTIVLVNEFIGKINQYFNNPCEPNFGIVFSRYNDMNDVEQEKWIGLYAYCLLHWAINIYKLTILKSRKRDSGRIPEIIYREKQILLAKIDIWIKFCNPLQENNLLQFFYASK